MTVDYRLNQIVALQAELREIQDRLRGNSSDGGGGGMNDQRLTRLENQFDRLRDDNASLREGLTNVRVDVATLAERVAHLPSKDFIAKASLGIVAAITAVITFADKLQALVK